KNCGLALASSRCLNRSCPRLPNMHRLSHSQRRATNNLNFELSKEMFQMENMKAVRMHNYGGPEVLRFEDAPRPTPASGELLVRVHAASVNPIDWKVRAG